jgi:hypothetical protein
MPPLLHDIWMRRGLSLLWGAAALAKVRPGEVLSLRSLFRSADAGFPDPLPSNGGRLLMATGLQGALDVLTPDDAEDWVKNSIRPVLDCFQQEKGGECALCFWLPSGQARIIARPASAEYHWRLPTGHGDKTLPLSELIFSGADDDLQEIVDRSPEGASVRIGLYHPRVS